MKPQLSDHPEMLTGRLLRIYNNSEKVRLSKAGPCDFRVEINKQEAPRSMSRPESRGPGSGAWTSAALQKLRVGFFPWLAGGAAWALEQQWLERTGLEITGSGT